MLLDTTELFDACRKGDRATVEQICEANAEAINCEDARGFTPLIIAVYNNQPSVVEYLLEKGAKSEAFDVTGNTALMGVCFRGYKDIARMLLKAGADVNQVNSNNAPALIFAATFGHLEIAEMLLQNGADVTIRDVRGKSALDHAVIQENHAMVELLQRYSQMH